MTSFSNICACAFSRQDEEHTKAFKAAQLDSSCNSWTQYQSYCSKFFFSPPPPPPLKKKSMQQCFLFYGIWQRYCFCATNFYRDACIYSLTRSFIKVPWMGGGGGWGGGGFLPILKDKRLRAPSGVQRQWPLVGVHEANSPLKLTTL